MTSILPQDHSTHVFNVLFVICTLFGIEIVAPGRSVPLLCSSMWLVAIDALSFLLPVYSPTSISGFKPLTLSVLSIIDGFRFAQHNVSNLPFLNSR